MLRTFRILGAAVLGALALVTLTPVPTWIAIGYAVPPRLGPADAIVVLGGGLVNGSLGDPSVQRMVEGVHLLRLGLAPIILFTGEPSEPELRARRAEELGVPPDAILTATANTTREEASVAGALLRPRGARSVLLVTGSFHLIRARATFEREGFLVLPAPADQLATVGSGATERLFITRALARELVAQWYYQLAGYLQGGRLQVSTVRFAHDVSVIVLVGLTSLGAYLAGTRLFGLPRPALTGAVRATLEVIGMAAVFLLANLGLAALAIGLVRGGAGHFISVYTIDDLAVAGASLLQGFLFRWWWGRQ